MTIDYSPAGGGAVELVREVGAVKLGVAALGEVDTGSVVASGFTMSLKKSQIISFELCFY